MPTTKSPTDPKPTIYVERPRCPACHSTSLSTYHSTPQGDGSTRRHTECQTCGLKFFVVIE